MPDSMRNKNWFSSHHTLKIYGSFLNLDDDRNGMLSPLELQKYKNDTFTRFWIDRVFSSTQTYDKEMDFTGYLGKESLLRLR